MIEHTVETRRLLCHVLRPQVVDELAVPVFNNNVSNAAMVRMFSRRSVFSLAVCLTAAMVSLEVTPSRTEQFAVYKASKEK